MTKSPIEISNGVAATADNGDIVNCDVCHRAMFTNDVGGNFFTTDEPWWVCDDCGQRAAPDLWPLLLELRATRDFTVTLVGRHGRPVCETCEPERFHSLRGLAARLNLAMDRPIHNEPSGVQ